MFNQEFAYFHDNGWEETSELRLVRQVNERTNLSYLNSLEFQDRNNYFSNLQLFTVHRKINEKWSRDFRLGAIYSSQNGGQADRYFSQLNFYQKVHEDWVFFAVSPELYYDRENAWKSAYALNFRFDVYFSE
ncbi:hypothetical protein IB286_02660 [Spongiibacter sp. KMU-158]|uniref:Uncharacterized protein n=1 Tax=Spongiibacter pelagi TaxID=2760804 RepID=A0A927BYH3_9GAMM|nr:hypothetical protein [Spongiibacter pelagi]MBD2857893.1 hypothetical protein [Spongiibacter pelagi]